MWYWSIINGRRGFMDSLLVNSQNLSILDNAPSKSLFNISISLEKAKTKQKTNNIYSYVTIIFLQYGGLLSVRNRRVSILNSNPLWGPRRNLAVPAGMASYCPHSANLYRPGLQKVLQPPRSHLNFGGLHLLLEFWSWMRSMRRESWLLGHPKFFGWIFFLIAKMAW